MTFVYPWVLLALLLIPLFYRAKSSSKIEQVFSKEILSKLEFGSFSRRNIKFYLLVISFVLMIIALARPVMLSDKMKEVNQKSFNFVIALDISKSMEANDVFPSRLMFAKKAIFEVMQRVPEANIAVVAYTNDAFLVSPFSNDFKSIKFLLENLDSDSLTSKGSQVLSALKASQKVFKSTKDDKKSILLVSDGADGRDLDKIKEYLEQNSIRLYALSIGTKKGTTLSDGNGGYLKDKNGNIVISKRDDSLSKVLNGGTYLSSTGELDKLDWLVDKIKDGVDKKEVKRDKFEGAKELFYYPLVVSLFLIFFAFNSLRLPFLLVLLLVRVDSEAGMFDFVDIYKGQKSYKEKNYEEAQKSFSKIDSNSAKYNQANALYKQKKYKEALKTYESIEGFDKEMEHKRLHNIGNSYANLGKTDEAIKSYEKALKLEDDTDTKANLEYLKKKKQQQQKQQQKNGENKKKQNKKDKKNNKNSDGKQKQKENKQNDKKENKKNSDGEQKKKADKKSSQKKQQGNPKKEDKMKKISEAEAKKWEKRMDNQKFKTRPMKLKKGEQNEIYW
jgi:Ca-activated chloride channel family protein